METPMSAVLPQQKAGALAWRLVRLLRRKRSPAAVAYSVGGDEYDESLDSSINSLSKLKLSGNLPAAYSLDAFFRNAAEKKGAQQSSPASATDAAAHAFITRLFVRVSAVKAVYAQLQLTQHPYDVEVIQSVDATLVAELTKLCDHKRRYVRDPVYAACAGALFSEVYLESVSDADGEDGGRTALALARDHVVAFTVVLRFKVGRKVMQCWVYLSRPVQ